MSTLRELFRGELGPYKPKLTLTVVAVGPVHKYRMDGEDREMKAAVLTDGEELVKLHVYDRTKFPRLQEGNVLSLLNVITKKEDGRNIITATKYSKIFCGKTEDVSEGLKAAANNILNPPPAETVAIQQALSSPPKKKVSIRGRIVQEGQPQTVKVKGDDVPIKAIHVEDKSARAKITLWREAVHSDVRPGDYVTVTDVITNTWRNETSLSTTTRSIMQKCDEPIEALSGTVIGTSVEETMVEFLLEDDNGNQLMNQLKLCLGRSSGRLSRKQWWNFFLKMTV